MIKFNTCPNCKKKMFSLIYHKGKSSKTINRKYCEKCDEIFYIDYIKE